MFGFYFVAHARTLYTINIYLARVCVCFCSIWHIFLYFVCIFFLLFHSPTHYIFFCFSLFLSFLFDHVFISFQHIFYRRRIRNEHPKMNGWTFCHIQSSHRMVIVFYYWRAFKRLVLNISLISNMLQ